MMNGDSMMSVLGGRVSALDGSSSRRDIHVDDGVIVAAPHGTAGTVIDAAGAHVVPLTVESAIAQRGESETSSSELVPDHPATFAVVRRPVGENEIRRMLVVSPRDLVAVVVDGHLEAKDGRPVRPPGVDLAVAETARSWVGVWSDEVRGLDQHLLADGRYTETRGARADAYTGRYWVQGDRITYLDDSGFWAFGELLVDVLHHAGFVMRRP
jgi:hypothetical protein